ncbi:MFS transporter [Rhodobacteraceae bacterium B1Z28]|uniref:MFS transporter n=1 Tax=Ruegeria haliotis TaxID=2747601 RepID=A0ABX2PR15_9RHOB|nr:MFS transporter [Ruegeria haliotis]NVO55519.1 MFS transporter [Ruegeria haliotis]
MDHTETPKKPDTVENRNYQLIFWSGALQTIGGQLVNPRLVLPFLYLALGAPTIIAGLLLPFVTGARLIAEIFVSPFINRVTRAKLAVYVPNILTGAVLAILALFATDLSQTMVVLLFLITAIVMGLCQGVTSLGTSQIYGTSVPEGKRNRMVFAQATVSGVLAILVVWATKDLLVSEKPMQRHIVVMWCGVIAMFAAGLSFAGVRLFEDEQPAAPEPTKKPKPLAELATGFKTGMAYPWYRKFLLARLLFVSVELAMPFYTIHAATYHVGTKHSLSYFVIGASAGVVIGSVLWGWLSGRISVKPVMWLGCLISTLSAVLALGFTFTGYAQNVWLYAAVILLLSLGGNGVIYGRYLYLIEVTKKQERPYLVALGDVCAGLVGIVFAAILGAVAHLHDPITPIFVLAVLNLIAMLYAFRLPPPNPKGAAPAHESSV